MPDGGKAVVKLAFKVIATGAIGTSLEGRLSKANGIMQVSHWFPIVSTATACAIRAIRSSPGGLQDPPGADHRFLERPHRRARQGRQQLGRSHVYELTDARDFAFGASPTYRTVSAPSAGSSVVVYYTTGAGTTALASATAALARFESAFGDYPWRATSSRRPGARARE